MRMALAKTGVALVCTTLMVGCGASRTVKGGAVGAGAGGLLGGVIGHKAGNTAAGVLIGAAVGGSAGALIGRYMDKQAEELRKDLKNAEVERIGEGIVITFDSGLLFDVNSSVLQPAAKDNAKELARVLSKYEDTKVLVVGHTDSTGDHDYNVELSRKRAQSVAGHLAKLGVKEVRIDEQGKGETDPVAENDSDKGRQANRRVEVAIFANEKLRKAAERGDIGQPNDEKDEQGVRNADEAKARKG